MLVVLLLARRCCGGCTLVVCMTQGVRAMKWTREHTLGHQSVLRMKVTSRQRNKECAGTAPTTSPTHGNGRVVVDVVGQAMVMTAGIVWCTAK